MISRERKRCLLFHFFGDILLGPRQQGHCIFLFSSFSKMSSSVEDTPRPPLVSHRVVQFIALLIHVTTFITTLQLFAKNIAKEHKDWDALTTGIAAVAATASLYFLFFLLIGMTIGSAAASGIIERTEVALDYINVVTALLLCGFYLSITIATMDWSAWLIPGTGVLILVIVVCYGANQS